MAGELPTNELGSTGLRVTRLGYGTAVEGTIAGKEWERMLNQVLDHGINFIDTANDYGLSFGMPAEEQIGRYIGHRRSEYYLATKCGCSPEGHVWTRENLFRGLHESLERLQADYVDVMQMHNPSVQECEAGDLVRALEEMRGQGKVRWIGVSTTLPDLPTFLEWGVFDVFQIPYSALEREHEEWIARAAQAGIGIVIRGGVAKGEPGQGHGNPTQWDAFERAGLSALQPAEESRTTFMLRYTLSSPDVHTTIVGTANADHLKANLEAVGRGPLPQEIRTAVDQRLNRLPA